MPALSYFSLPSTHSSPITPSPPIPLHPLQPSPSLLTLRTRHPWRRRHPASSPRPPSRLTANASTARQLHPLTHRQQSADRLDDRCRHPHDHAAGQLAGQHVEGKGAAADLEDRVKVRFGKGDDGSGENLRAHREAW